jgi:hypothetical protein
MQLVRRRPTISAHRVAVGGGGWRRRVVERRRAERGARPRAARSEHQATEHGNADRDHRSSLPWLEQNATLGQLAHKRVLAAQTRANERYERGAALARPDRRNLRECPLAKCCVWRTRFVIPEGVHFREHSERSAGLLREQPTSAKTTPGPEIGGRRCGFDSGDGLDPARFLRLGRWGSHWGGHWG